MILRRTQTLGQSKLKLHKSVKPPNHCAITISKSKDCYLTYQASVTFKPLIVNLVYCLWPVLTMHRTMFQPPDYTLKMKVQIEPT